MIACKKILFYIFVISIGCVIVYLISCDPYSFDKVKNAKLKAHICDKESIVYLGDYFEKRGLQSEIHDLINLYEKCAKFEGRIQKGKEL